MTSDASITVGYEEWLGYECENIGYATLMITYLEREYGHECPAFRKDV